MSFSIGAKEELCHQPLDRACCMLAEISALTQTSASLGFQGAGRFSVTYRVENTTLARRIFTMLKKSLDVSPQLQFVQHTRLGGRTACVLTLEGGDAQKLLIAMSMMERHDDGSVTLKRTEPRVPLTRQCCRRAYLRGAFLGAGSITSPEKGYHFEIIAGDDAMCQSVLRQMERCGLPAGHITRRGKQVVYLKGSQHISDVLALMGAPTSMMELENIRITRQMRGNINRASGCDDRNYERAAAASDAQVKAITMISIQRGLASLPPALRELAHLRLENPSVSLTELGQMMDPPLTKSGVSNRMKRLMATADEIAGELEQHQKPQ
ncbi:MAG: DNA-binding protein WhiA [bacterium]|nr:DNA-binding protein WhiA [bacterium]